MKNVKSLIAILLVALFCVSALISCDKPEAKLSDAEQARDYLKALYRSSAELTPSDYKVTSSVKVNGATFDVIWTVDVAEGVTVGEVNKEDSTVTIDVNEQTPEKLSYNLTGTIKDADGKEYSVTFPHTIPAFKELSFAEYINAAVGDPVVVKGVVTGIMSKSKGNSYNCLYLQDADGGYYPYSLASDPVEDGIEIGMTVRVSGTKDVYSGTHEIKDPAAEILSTEKTAVTPVDYTDIYKNAATLKDEALVSQQAMLVTVKGVEITSQDAKNGYYRFKLGELESYIRISSSVCPITKDEQTAFISGHTEHTGWIANATGIVCVYDGAFYLTPVSADAFEYVGLPEKSPAEMAAYEKEGLTFVEKITEDGEIELPETGKAYTDVKIAWTSDNDCAVVDGGKLVVTLPETDTVVKLTATLTSGDATETKEFEIAVDAASTALYAATPVGEAKEGTFKFVIFQNSIGKTLYFDGTVNDSEYLATTEKAEKAADVTVVAVDGGYALKVGEKFIEVYENGSQKVRIHLVDASTGAWAWNDECKVFTFTLAGCAKDSNNGEYYLGTYKTYDTFSASLTSYISGEKAADVDVSQFPGRFCTLAQADYKAEKLAEAKEGTYKFVIFQNSIGKTLYFDGTVNDSEYLATTEKAEKAADVTVVAVDGGYALKVGEKFIEVYENGSQKVRIHLVDAATGAWAWNDECKVFTFTLAGCAKDSNNGEYYLGTYKTYDTFSASLTSYISGEKAADVDVSQFPGRLCTMTLAALSHKNLDAAAEGTYKFAIFQNAIGKTLYFDGTVNDSEYLATTEKYEKAADVTVAAVDGGYALKVGEKFIEVYENGSQKVRIHLVDAATGTWAWNDECKVFTFTLAGCAKDSNNGEYYLGTYKTYDTFSASLTSYISGEKAADVDVSQFPGRLTVLGFAD